MPNVVQGELFSSWIDKNNFDIEADLDIKVVDLFSGCGGLSLGLKQAKFNVLAAFDNWDKAIEIYKQNFDHDVFVHDLSKVDKSIKLIKKYAPNMIVGGPPCQDFSHAGKRKEADKASLTLSYARIIKQCSPDWFIMENVDRAQKSLTFQAARNIFIESGYGLTERVLDASLCGVPQKRKRFFCIGHKYSSNGFLNNIIDRRLANKPMTVREYMKDELDVDYYYRHPRNYNRRGIFSVDEPSPTVRGVNRPIPETYQKHKGDAADPSDNVRPLTTIERARIQTFPSTFAFKGTKTNLEQMIGNAVPVKLAEFVARAVAIYHSNNRPDR